MRFAAPLTFSLLALSAGATSLQKLGLDEMIQKSTGIIRGKVTASYSGMVGVDVFTFYKIQVVEAFKGATVSQIDLAVPGGVSGRIRQVVPGAPEVVVGKEYVVFYWTSKSGLSQIIGLTQGLFSENPDSPTNPLLLQPASTETMLGPDGQPVADQPLTLRMSELRSRVGKVLAKGALKN
jgi:hypothetical protein